MVRGAAVLACALMGLSFLLLVRAFVMSDFSVALVADNSHTLKPMIYKIAGTWGNHEGSMAMWCLVTLVFGAAGAMALKREDPVFVARTLGVQGILGLAALAYLLLASNPYVRLDPAPLQGGDLNPLLQDPALAAHPPLLYVGYVGFSFVFSLAAAGLMAGRIDRDWAMTARSWTLVAWVFLTLGIGLGSYWAYYELGWGGWWFWDPVENASLMPWLIGAALLHSLAVTQKRGGFAAWTALLAVMAFVFSILGAFLVRSGVLTSVHAFAIDPQRGLVLLGGLVGLGGGALLLFGLKAGGLGRGPEFRMLSREGALLANNLVVAVATATVLLGTLYPLLIEAASGEKASVGPPYFDATFSPLMGLLLVFLPVVQAWRWGQEDTEGLWRWGVAIAAAVAAAVIAGLTLKGLGVVAALGIALGVWLIAGTVIELMRRALWKPARVFSLPARVWGMSLAHAGLGLFVLGAVWETSLRLERTLAMPEGGRAEIAGWNLQLESVRAVEGPNWYADRAVITASRGDTQVTLSPEKRFYPAARMPTTETAIHKTGWGDLYLALGEYRAQEGVWTFRAYYNPLIDAVFGGVLLMALGGLFCVLPRRRRAARTAAGKGAVSPVAEAPA
jgi:cytochrome c-type biogenesis protein CcmF